MQVSPIPRWQPFTLASLADGNKELHISLQPRVSDGEAPDAANWSDQMIREVAHLRYYANRQPDPLRIRLVGPFGGVLANKDLYEEASASAVVFVCMGTGFTACTQGMSSMRVVRGENIQARLLWRGTNLGYLWHKVDPVCREYKVENVLSGSYGGNQYPDRSRFYADVVGIVSGFNDRHSYQKVLVAACGSSLMVKTLREQLEAANCMNPVEAESFG